MEGNRQQVVELSCNGIKCLQVCNTAGRISERDLYALDNTIIWHKQSPFANTQPTIPRSWAYQTNCMQIILCFLCIASFISTRSAQHQTNNQAFIKNLSTLWFKTWNSTTGQLNVPQAFISELTIWQPDRQELQAWDCLPIPSRTDSVVRNISSVPESAENIINQNYTISHSEKGYNPITIKNHACKNKWSTCLGAWQIKWTLSHVYVGTAYLTNVSVRDWWVKCPNHRQAK